MKRVWQFIGILILLIILTGAGIYAFTPGGKLLSYLAPRIQVVKLSNLVVANDQATFHLHLQATSPLLPVTINRLQYHFKLFDQTICQGNQLITAKQNGKVQPLTLPIRVNYKQALPLLQQQIKGGNPVNAVFEVSGRIPFAGRHTLTRQENLTFFIPVLPVPKITLLETEEIGFQHVRLILHLNISNPNKFDYYLRDFSLTAELPGYQAMAENTPKDYLIKANQVTPIKIPSTKAIGKSDINNLFKGNSLLQYTLKTAMVLEPVDVPIDPILYKATDSGSVRVPQDI